MGTLLSHTDRSGSRAMLPHSFVLHETGAREYFWEGEGLLSIKSFFGGTAYYDAGSGRYAVGDESYLILNHGRRYSITIDAAQPMESFCLFFTPGMAERAYRAAHMPAGDLLDDPMRLHGEPLQFFERTYHHDNLLSPALLSLRAACRKQARDRAWLDERLHDLVARLIAVHQRSCSEADAMDALRPATRHELYRRLHIARDFIEAMYATPVMLEDIARAACLSPNHLLRTFRQAFGVTPHSYLTRVRLRQARRLIETTSLPVAEIVLLVGLESPSTFSGRFRREFGCAPLDLRRRKR